MAHIIFNRKITPDYYKMRVFCPEIAVRAKPGQFVMVRVTDLFDPLLRRPFAIHRLCGANKSALFHESPSCIEVLYHIAGKGTLILSEKQRGEALDLFGPLGNGFHLEHDLKTAVLIAGGIGVAPLFSLAQALKEKKGTRATAPKVFVFLGGKTAQDVLCRNDFKKLGTTVAVSTEDGSSGTTGLVTDLLRDFFSKCPPSEGIPPTLFGCGPLPMLRALSEIARVHALPCQISLESRMACGVGACLGCTIPTRSDQNKGLSYQRACKEGPVFESTAIAWDHTHSLVLNG
jgi:dihydroorotate dehydrogenase electron transfer subunit